MLRNYFSLETKKNLKLLKQSHSSWIPSSLLYDDDDDDFDLRFDPNRFDVVEEPPPVHILYPRPSYNKACSKLSRNYNQVINSTLIATSLFIYFSICHLFL